jgi:hypothetical protein
MDVSSVGPNLYPFQRHREADTRVRSGIQPVRSVQTNYDSSIGRYVSQVVADGEVVRQFPTAGAVSFIRSFKTVVLSLFGRVI